MKPDLFRGLTDKLKVTWRTSNAVEKILTITFALALTAILSVVFINATTTSYVPLNPNSINSNLSESKIQLDALKIPYQIKDQSIYVPKDRLTQAQIALSDQGLSRNSSSKGYGLFDNNTWIKGEKELQILELRALKGQLENDLSQFENIRGATISLDIPPQRISGLSPTSNSKASVILNLKPGARLNNQELRAISYHLASAVKGLTPSMIAISDTSGKLYQSIDTEGSFDSMRNSELSAEEHLKMKIDGMLSKIVGSDNFYTTVQIVMNRSRVTEERKIYNGTVDGVNLGQPVLMSVVENLQGQSKSSYSSPEISSQVKEMAVPSDTMTITSSPGKISGISIAVLINKAFLKTYLDGLNGSDVGALQRDIQTQLSTILRGYDVRVHQAVNFVDFDVTSTQSLPVRTEVFNIESEKTPGLNDYWTLAMAILAGVGTFVALLLIDTLWGSRSRPIDKSKYSSKNVSISDMMEVIQSKAENQPDQIANILRHWLKEKPVTSQKN